MLCSIFAHSQVSSKNITWTGRKTLVHQWYSQFCFVWIHQSIYWDMFLPHEQLATCSLNALYCRQWNGIKKNSFFSIGGKICHPHSGGLFLWSSVLNVAAHCPYTGIKAFSAFPRFCCPKSFLYIAAYSRRLQFFQVKADKLVPCNWIDHGNAARCVYTSHLYCRSESAPAFWIIYTPKRYRGGTSLLSSAPLPNQKRDKRR